MRDRSWVGMATLELYDRSSPPLVTMLRITDTGQAVIRSALAPIVELMADLERSLGTAGENRSRSH